jgi:DHA2 family multidrug resistance protein
MGTLRNEQLGNATGLYNLMRNLGGSIGISGATTMLSRWSQVHQASMVHRLTDFDAPYREHVGALAAAFAASGSSPPVAAEQARGAIYGMLGQQAAVWAYVDDFRTLGYLCFFLVPLAFLFRRVKAGKGAGAAAAH